MTLIPALRNSISRTARSRGLQLLASSLVQVRCQFVVRHMMRMIACASRNQFPAEARVVIHFKYVHAGMRDARVDQVVERSLPAALGSDGVVRQSGQH